MDNEKIMLIFKALSNEVRLSILQMLKDTETTVPNQIHLQESDDFHGGACVGNIQEKIGLSQSTTSQYLAILHESGLLEKQRIGQWTYYRRNEETIKQLKTFIGSNL